jgi:hypothetical protein
MMLRATGSSDPADRKGGRMVDVLGALVPTGLLAFFFEWVMRRFIGGPVARVFIANAVSLAISTVAGGYGHADYGPPQFLPSFFLYGLAQVVWLVVMLLRQRGQRTA